MNKGNHLSSDVMLFIDVVDIGLPGKRALPLRWLSASLGFHDLAASHWLSLVTGSGFGVVNLLQREKRGKAQRENKEEQKYFRSQ